MKKRKKLIIVLVVIIILILIAVLSSLGSQSSFTDKYEGVDLSADVEGVDKENTYTKYLQEHKDASYPTADISVDLFDYNATGDVEVLTDYDGAEKVLYTEDGSQVEWKVQVGQAGFYNLYVEYMDVESRGVDMERSVRINGELPFEGASTLVFTRMWENGGEVKKDNQGNEIRPSQTEVFEWQSACCKDDMGYEVEPYRFYFEQGENTITFIADNEPMVIKNFVLKAVTEQKTYDKYIQAVPDVHSGKTAENYIETIQGEDASLKSSASLYGKYDRSSPATEPYDVFHTILNYIGGDSWSKSGQWIEWEFEVPEDGFYHISVKGRQNYQRGGISNRTVYIDGEIPFKEVQSVSFLYDSSWNETVLGDADGNAYDFHLTKGTHTIRLEATLGEMGGMLGELEDSVYRLNTIYRKVLVLTGADPDEFRDYNIDKVYPEIIEAMDLESKRLYKAVDELVAYTGQKSDKIAAAQTIAIQLERFVKDPGKITTQFKVFKDNITALGTAINGMCESKLDIDSITIMGSNKSAPKVKDGILAKITHTVKSFLASFIVDYDSLGDVYDKEQSIEVWIVTGRDQSTVLKTMIDDSFTPESGIPVNLKLVNVNALLSAVVAGNGPDVVLSVDSALPVDYALRNAVEDLTQFDDLDETLEQFYESAYVPFEFEDGVYALPETQVFNLLFYRSDIMEELGLEIPKTWDDLMDILPTLQGNNMSVGTHYTNIGILYSMIYQNGGTIYNESGSKTTIDKEAGISAFEDFTSLFTDYGVPIEFDFVSRFRSGEMPLGIADYTTYNTLVVSAPEIRGLWDFTYIPGTERMDEAGNTIMDDSVHTAGVCCMMLRNDDEKVKQNAWEFMKWWVSSDAQVRFGREIESVLGSSARYATANVNALEQLAWTSSQINVLEEQLSNGVGLRQVAGGYYTPRHINNAIRKVINQKENARETLIDYARTINEELLKKRKEFGLSVE